MSSARRESFPPFDALRLPPIITQLDFGLPSRLQPLVISSPASSTSPLIALSSSLPSIGLSSQTDPAYVRPSPARRHVRIPTVLNYPLVRSSSFPSVLAAQRGLLPSSSAFATTDEVIPPSASPATGMPYSDVFGPRSEVRACVSLR